MLRRGRAHTRLILTQRGQRLRARVDAGGRGSHATESASLILYDRLRRARTTPRSGGAEGIRQASTPPRDVPHTGATRRGRKQEMATLRSRYYKFLPLTTRVVALRKVKCRVRR